MKKKEVRCRECAFFNKFNECTKTNRKQNIVSLTTLTEDTAPSWCPIVRRIGGRPKKKLSPRKRLTKRLDTLWAKAVKLLAHDRCEIVVSKKRCVNVVGEGTGHGLNSHHIIGRSNLNVRWDVNNGVALCVKHHVFSVWSAHKNPFWFLDNMFKMRGKKMVELEKKALLNNGIAKYTMEELEQIELGLIKIIKKEGG